MHQIACTYIAVPQQKWNNTYLETINKLEGGNIANFCSQDKELTKLQFCLKNPRQKRKQANHVILEACL